MTENSSGNTREPVRDMRADQRGIKEPREGQSYQILVQMLEKGQF